MKKGKYLIGIIIICIVVFIGIEFFRKDEHQDIDNNIENNATNNVNTIQENGENNTVIEENSTTEPPQAGPVEEIKDGQELLKKAEILNLNDRVLSIDDAINKFKQEEKVVVETPVFIKKEYFV